MVESLVGWVFASAAMTVAIGWWLQYRRRAEQRWLAALDAYAERQLVREKRLRALQKPWTYSTSRSVANEFPRRIRTGQLKRQHGRKNDANPIR